MKSTLTSDQISQYENDGFLIIEDFLDREELNFWAIV